MNVGPHNVAGLVIFVYKNRLDHKCNENHFIWLASRIKHLVAIVLPL